MSSERDRNFNSFPYLTYMMKTQNELEKRRAGEKKKYVENFHLEKLTSWTNYLFMLSMIGGYEGEVWKALFIYLFSGFMAWNFMSNLWANSRNLTWHMCHIIFHISRIWSHLKFDTLVFAVVLASMSQFTDSFIIEKISIYFLFPFLNDVVKFQELSPFKIVLLWKRSFWNGREKEKSKQFIFLSKMERRFVRWWSVWEIWRKYIGIEKKIKRQLIKISRIDEFMIWHSGNLVLLSRIFFMNFINFVENVSKKFFENYFSVCLKTILDFPWKISWIFVEKYYGFSLKTFLDFLWKLF